MKDLLIQLEIEFDLERAIKANRKFLNFHRKKQINFKRITPMVLVGAFLLLLGFFIHSEGLTILSLIYLGGLVLYFAYYYIQFEIAFQQAVKSLNKYSLKTGESFTFIINSEHIEYITENTKSEFHWRLVVGYEENDDDLYLYQKNREVLDIISKAVIGEGNYNTLLQFLENRFAISHADPE